MNNPQVPRGTLIKAYVEGETAPYVCMLCLLDVRQPDLGKPEIEGLWAAVIIEGADAGNRLDDAQWLPTTPNLRGISYAQLAELLGKDWWRATIDGVTLETLVRQSQPVPIGTWLTDGQGNSGILFEGPGNHCSVVSPSRWRVLSSYPVAAPTLADLSPWQVAE